MLLPATDHRTWKLINFRRTSSLLAAEFLHGLYKRHDPFLNPIYFAHTRVCFRPWESRAYAPTREWDLVALRFGGRILRRLPALQEEFERILGRPRVRSRRLLATLDALEPAQLADAELMDVLLDMHHVPLGDIYEVNLVQVEHALEAAVRQHCSSLGDDARGMQVLALCAAGAETTASGTLEQEFLRLASARRTLAYDERGMQQELERLVQLHARLGSGYGADTVTLESLAARLQRYLDLDQDAFERATRRGPCADEDPRTEQLIADPTLDTLIGLMRRTGELRDSNKQLLGELTAHRGRFLDEIARRRELERESVRLYLLEELLTLIEHGWRVPSAIIERRRREGVVLARTEATEWSAAIASGSASLRPSEVLFGSPASRGKHVGVVRIGRAAADLDRFQVGDVLVAQGTDFDLALLLSTAGAVVTEEGGVLSHAAVIARERGIPCVIDVAAATELLVEGEQVEVDGDSGSVRRIAQHPAPDRQPVPAASRAGLLQPLRAVSDSSQAGNKAANLRLLSLAGVPIPSDVLVVPITVVDRLRASHADAAELWRGVIADIVAAARGRALCLRSSSLVEDSANHSGAGIYESAINVQPEPAAIRDALSRVIDSSVSKIAESYQRGSRPSRAFDSRIAVLVHEYVDCDYQGVAHTRSPWTVGSSLIECFEGHASAAAPQRRGVLLERPYTQRAIDAGSDAIPSLWSTLRRVDSWAHQCAAVLGGPSDVEWCVSGGAVIILQARRLTDVQVSDRSWNGTTAAVGNES